MLIARLFLGFFLLFASQGLAWAWQARVVSITDGDTIVVENPADGRRVTVRLYGIDAPERKQPMGETARGFVFAVALHRLVEVEEKGPDRYKRQVAVIRLPSGESLQELLLESGLALVWPRYCRNCQEWELLQENAREKQQGLWADPDAIPPWQWRRGARP